VSSIFPWLSQVAQRYETYKFRQLKFRIHPRAPTDEAGTIGMVFDFDALDTAPASQMEALSYGDKTADSVWREQVLNVNLAAGDKQPARYTRAGIVAAVSDLKTYDVGALHVFCDGTGAITLGLLEVVYTVDLFTPQIQYPVGGTWLTTAGLDATHLIGNTATFVGDTDAIAPFTWTSTSVLTFSQNFEGVIAFSVTGTGLGSDFAPVASTTGAAAVIVQTVNAGATNTVGWCRVRATNGTTVTPTITATTVTNVRYTLAKCAYAALV
jgi:hypothetical protein